MRHNGEGPSPAGAAGCADPAAHVLDGVQDGMALKRTLLILAGALALTSAQPPRPAEAARLFGVCVLPPCDPVEPEDDGLIDPLRYEAELVFRGGEDQEDAESAVNGASDLLRRDDEAAPGASGLIARARGDYRRILAALYQQGYYGPAISILIGGEEATVLEPDADLPDGVAVEVIVDPGPAFTFGRAEIVDRAPRPLDRGDDVDLPEDEGFAPGERARASAVRRARRLSVEAWRQQGYAKAEIERREVVADHPERQLDVVLDVDPGRRASYGEVSVRGTERMIPSFVATQTGLRVGEEYDPDDLDRARDRLARLQVFRTIRLIEDEEIGPDGLLPIEVVVDERPLRRVGVGATFSTIDGLGAETFFLHRNLFGRAERLRLDASVSGIGTEDFEGGDDENPFEGFDYQLGVNLVLPGRFTPDTDVTFDARGIRQTLQNYRETSLDVAVGLNHIFTPELTGRLGVAFSRSRFEDDLTRLAGTDGRDFTALGLVAGLTYDTRDDALDATRGLYIDADASPYYAFENENFAVRGDVEGRAYLGFGEDDTVVVAARALVGATVGADIDQTAPDRLYFAGGGGSVRGYGFQSIGVERLDPATGQPVIDPSTNEPVVTGGLSVVEGSLELRGRRLFGTNFGAAVFADAGVVSADQFADFSDVRVGVGAGIRYHTGLGPIRLDVAIPVNPRSSDDGYGLYVGLGQAF